MAVSILHIDIETRSSADLRRVGVHRYVEEQDFTILLLAYGLDDGPVCVLDFSLYAHDADRVRKAQAELYRMLLDPGVRKTAFNASFERVCLARFFGVPMPASQWECTMVRALSLGIPGTLGDVGQRLGIEQGQRKLDGFGLIRKFCIPQAYDGKYKTAAEYPVEWARFKQYCAQDVEAERAVHRRLHNFPMPASEQEMWTIDQEINDRGVMVDADMARIAQEQARKELERLEREAVEVTGVSNARSRQQVLDWLRTEQALEGLGEAPDLQKKTVEKLLRSPQPERIERLLRLRQEISKSSVSKYAAMLRSINDDGRVRGLLQFYGAVRTGRWAGRRVQVQNLPKNTDINLDELRSILLTDPDSLGFYTDSVMDTLSQLIRTAFVAPPGRVLVSVDFSAIEARMLAWLADETWRLNVFRGDGRIYEASAESSFKLPPGSVKKGDPYRDKGKVSELTCGFGGGVRALEKMGGLDMGLTELELEEIKVRWREASPRIVLFWEALEKAAKQAIREQSRVNVGSVHDLLLRGAGHRPLDPDAGAHKVWFAFKSRSLFMELPSGRSLCYPRAHLDASDYYEKIVFAGPHPKTGKWSWCDTYGGKLAENVTQAASSDVLRAAVKRVNAEAPDYDLVFTVHDELVAECDEDVADADEIVGIISHPLPWAKTLPLAATGSVLKHYKKED